MKIFVCQICGEVYIGRETPHSCPFCGVRKENLRMADGWEDRNNVSLNEVDEKNVKDALALEMSNTAFYQQASKKLSNQEAVLMFKGLFKVEREHASIYKKLLKLEETPMLTEDCPDSARECALESSKREKRAVEFYAQAAAVAENSRVKEVFTEIMKVESDHVALDEEMIKKF
ncbi:MAG: ferritin-like domain-containing protein [bacterium]